eukprot:RCo049029
MRPINSWCIIAVLICTFRLTDALNYDLATANPMTRIRWVSRNELTKLLRTNRTATVVLFYSSSCSFCEAMVDVLELVTWAFPTLPVVAVNGGAAPLRSVGYGVVAYPTALIIEDESVVSRFTSRKGYSFEEISDWITQTTRLTPEPVTKTRPSLTPLPYLHPNEITLACLAGAVTLFFLTYCVVRCEVAFMSYYLSRCCGDPAVGAPPDAGKMKVD